MARINTNIASLVAQSNLSRSTRDLTTSLQRLSTGLRINRGSDDPAGLIVSESLRTEIQGIRQAVDNSERASSVIATTEGYLAEVADLLNSINGLVVEAANTGGVSADEIAANQLQIDSAIDSITRISNTASFAGLDLLNGDLEYQVSGLATSAIAQATIFGADFGLQSTIPVQVQVVNSAQTGALFLSAPSGALTSTVTLEIAGNNGVQTLTLLSGRPLSAVVAAINTIKNSTGVSASLQTAGNQTSGMVFNSTSYGSDEFVSVKKIGAGGNFFQTYPGKGVGNAIQRDEGRDVTAIVNGSLAVGKGLNITHNSPTLNVELSLTVDYATRPGVLKTFDITGGGVVFQLGPDITAAQQVGFGVQSVAASRLGGETIGGVRQFLDSLKTGQPNSIVSGRAEQAAQVLKAAISDVSVLRGRLGSFEKNTLDTNLNSLSIGLENITASESKIRDTDFAAQTAALTRAQILQQAGTSVLATANVSAQNVLSLLG